VHLSVVSDLEGFYLPMFRQAELQLTSAFPNFKFHVWSSSVGGATEYQGHSVGLECVFPDATDEEADCVGMSVAVWHITTQPELLQASVDWGAGGHPDIWIELLENPVNFTQAAMAQVASQFPEMVSAFKQPLIAWSTRGSNV
jgi:hypothetical protein